MTREALEFIAGLKCGMFADRETVGDAYEYAMEIAKATDNPAAVTTAIHVLLNTIVKTTMEIQAKEEIK